MTRMAKIAEKLSTIPPKAIPKLAAICVLGRIAYCALGDAKADATLVKDFIEAEHSFYKIINYDQLSLHAGKPFQRCRASLSMFSPADSQSTKVFPIESCKTVHRLLTEQLERDQIHRSQSEVELAISIRNLLSSKTISVFQGRKITVQEALVATNMTKSSASK